ncbi:tetratricopeptide repeat protein [Desulfonatronospira sp. MSAO_Bac3]|uniref:tetratricopeptide repeat protein n=1 Tax=Desulfonatronospira sp. MSAO_Bac3 TaxID=2293857 RepID=UPI000FF05868|nr:tetratricopeptide repeat protein [Desulfonatronospira sp. MSAO_Bac3]RQD78844.1 MAG: tetratricopeptide repeat protein [Desulfonatronospira sp. MSAO_Bac3]
MSSGLLSSISIRRAVVAFAMLGLAVIFLSSIWYRIDSPSLVEETQTRQADQQMMARIAGLMQEVEQNPENVEAITELAGFFMQNQDWDKALSFWRRALSVDPDNQLALNQAGFTLFQMQQHEEAREKFERLLELNPENHQGHFNLAIIYKYYLDEQEKAREHLEKILEIDPDHPELLERVRQELETPAPGEGI